ncbi:MAG: HAD-IB family phosphatase [Clostridiales bacterium]|nr:HAD-IB family phosphatase [Clostridiales bacterium]
MARYDTMIFCDFDGTITTEETFVGTLMRLCEEKDLYEWFGKFQRGEITLRKCTETLFSLAPSSNWPKVEEYAKTVKIRPGFSEFLDKAKELGIPVVVISGGVRSMQEGILAPYMDRIDAFYSCDLDISGEYTVFTSKYADETHNMDKVKIMDMYDYGKAIAVGDMASTDLAMARNSDLIFARDELAAFLEEEGTEFYKWETFFDIIPHLS